MQRPLIAVLMLLSLAAVDVLTFHDLFEPHTVRDYLTLAASLLVFVYVVLEYLRGRKTSGNQPS